MNPSSLFLQCMIGNAITTEWMLVPLMKIHFVSLIFGSLKVFCTIGCYGAITALKLWQGAAMGQFGWLVGGKCYGKAAMCIMLLNKAD